MSALLVPLLAAPDAFAQTAGPPAEAPAGPDVVIAADLSPNATANSELRAALYETVRRQGYVAAGKRDIDGIAAQRGLMTAGSITIDPNQLTELRQALGVAVLVRVSRDSEDATGINARLTVVTSKGAHAQIVKVAGTGSPAPLEKALGQMLPTIYTPPAPKTAQSEIPPQAVGAITSAKVKPDDTLKARDAWEARGNLRPMYGAEVLLATTKINNVAFSDVNQRTGQVFTGKKDAWGVGGGVGVRIGLIYLPVPEPNLAAGTFMAFKLGVAVDNVFFWWYPPKDCDFSAGGCDVQRESKPLWVATGRPQLGFAFAAGRFSSEASWRGPLIGLAYSPALQFSMDITNVNSGKFRTNLAGVEASLDITRLNAGAANPDAEMQIRGSVWFLAPLDDDHPGMLTLGLGVIYY